MQQNQEYMLQAMYEEYQGTLRKIVRNCGVPYDYIDDVIQETFYSYYSHYSLEWDVNQKKAMLVRIARNKATDFFRKNKRHDSVSIETGDFGGEIEILSDYVMKDTLDSILDDEACRELYEFIKGLKEEWRDIALLRFVEGRTVVEVCEITGITGTVCRMRLSRIRKYMREWLDHRDES